MKNNRKLIFLGTLIVFVLFALAARQIAEAVGLPPLPPISVSLTTNKPILNLVENPSDSATLSWLIDGDASECTVGSNFGVGISEFGGSMVVSPLSTRTYLVRVSCSSVDGLSSGSASVTVNVITQTINIWQQVVGRIGPLANDGVGLCTAGTVACGVKSHLTEPQKIDQLLCCTLTAQAVSLGVGRTGGYWQIDADSNGDSFVCGGNGAVIGGGWSKDNQLDHGFCETLTGPVNFGSNNILYNLIGNMAINTDYTCSSDSILYGGKNMEGKNDVWGGFYCAKTFYNPPTLSISKSGTGFGTVSGPGIDCGLDCVESYNPSTSVTLIASAEAGSTFVGWSDACSGTGTTCMVTMNNSNKNAGATFNIVYLAPTLISKWQENNATVINKTIAPGGSVTLPFNFSNVGESGSKIWADCPNVPTSNIPGVNIPVPYCPHVELTAP